MKVYDVMLHEWTHKNKSSLKKWTPAIRTSILNYPSKVSVKDLANALVGGQTVILGHLEYTANDLDLIANEKKVGAASRHWKSQQIFAIDIDNDKYSKDDGSNKYITIDKAIKMCKSKKCLPAFIYTTLSHKEDHHKFRVVFVADKEIKSLDERTKFIESIFEVFAINNENLVDAQCADPSRLFYPGKELVYTNYDAVVNVNSLITRVKPSYKLEKLSSSSSSMRLKNKLKSDSEVINLLRNNQTTEAIKVVAESLESAGKPYSDWVTRSSTKDGTVTILYIIKDYCPVYGRDPLSPVFMHDPELYYDSAQHFPLEFLLGKKPNEHFNCVLPDHHDTVGSARIEKHHEDGSSIYHCYGCMGVDKYYDIFTLLEHAVGWTHALAKDFVNELLNVEFETEWQKERKEDISSYIDYLGSKQFEKRFPSLYKRLVSSNSYGVLIHLLLEGRRMIQDKFVTETELPVFFLGVREFQRRLHNSGMTIGVSRSSIQRKLNRITELKLLLPMSDKDLPVEFIERAHRKRFEKNYRYRVNYFAIPEFTLKLFADAEAIIAEGNDKNIRRNSYSRQTLLWANGEESANEQFVQDKDTGKSKETLKFYEKYKAAAEALLDKGYTSEKEILNHRRVRGMKKKKELSAIVMPQLLQELNLKVVRYSKYYKARFKIKQDKFSYGSSKIIVKSEDVPDSE